MITEGPPQRVLDSFTALESAPMSVIQEVAKVFSQVASSGKFPEARDLHPIAEAHGIAVTDITKWLNAAFGVMHYTQLHDDRVDNILADLAELQKIKSVRDVKARLDVFDPQMQELYGTVSHIRGTLSTTFPLLSGLTTRVVVAFATEPRVRSMTHTIDPYKPSIAKAIPLVVINMELDHFDDTKTVVLAITPKELDDVLKRLEMARSELKSVLSTQNLS
jgi:hypothetical protein